MKEIKKKKSTKYTKQEEKILEIGRGSTHGKGRKKMSQRKEETIRR